MVRKLFGLNLRRQIQTRLRRAGKITLVHRRCRALPAHGYAVSSAQRPTRPKQRIHQTYRRKTCSRSASAASTISSISAPLASVLEWLPSEHTTRLWVSNPPPLLVTNGPRFHRSTSQSCALPSRSPPPPYRSASPTSPTRTAAPSALFETAASDSCQAG